MKKLLILVLVLGIASTASAALSLADSALTVTINTTVAFNVDGDTASNIDWYVGNVPGKADVTGMVLDSSGNAGPNAYVNESPYGYNGYWELGSKDDDPDTWDIIAGTQFNGTITVGGTTGTYSIYLYDSGWTSTGVKDTLALTIVPEPMTIALLGLGGLFLRRRK